MLRRVLGVVLSWLVGMTGSMVAAEEDHRRLESVEEALAEQRARIDALEKQLAASQAAGDEGSVTASVTDGLRYKSKDGTTDIHVGGRFQEHARVVFNRPEGARTTPNGFFVRAARLQVDGTFHRDFGFVVQFDSPSGQVSPSTTTQSAYVEWKKHPACTLLFGQFKAPASQERLTSRVYSDFVEDSPLVRFVPGYDIGMMAQGRVLGGTTRYQVALINGRGHLDSGGRSRNDDNDDKEVVARLTLAPWSGSKDSPLRGVRLGSYGSMTKVDDVALSGSGVTVYDIVTPELGVTILDPNAAVLEGRRWRAGGEFSWELGPAALRAEYLLRQDDFENGAVSERVQTRAWYITATCLVTGENKRVEARTVPERSFGPEEGWGAVELVFRVAEAEIGDDIQTVGVSLAGQSNEVTTYTAGVNWWLTRNVRFSVNVIEEDYHHKIDFGGGRSEDSLTGLLFRAQIDF